MLAGKGRLRSHRMLRRVMDGRVGMNSSDNAAHASPILDLANPILCGDGPMEVADKEVGDVSEGALEVGNDGK